MEIDISYRITYELNSGTNNSQNPEKFKTDQNVTLYEPTREGYTFTGWWLDEECETTQISGWNAGEKNEHITIYAGWTSAEVQRILAMTQSDTVKLEGEYSGGDITSIRKALQKLYSQNPNIKITLDLSDLIVDENDLIFTGTNNIISVTLPKSAETVTTKAFFECANLKKIIIPEDTSNTEPELFSFGDYSFANCPNLKVILNYSNKVLYADETFLDGSKGYPMEFYDLGGSPFSGTILFMNGGGTRPAITSTTPPVQTNDGFRFAYNNNIWYLVDYEGESTNMILPDSFSLDGTTITEYSIYSRSFNNRKDITSITISSSVTNMGTSTFEGCSELTEIIIQEGMVAAIENYAFMNCSKLNSISFSSTVSVINQGSFNGCTKLTSLNIPANIKSIGTSAFANCTALTNVIISSGVETIGESVFENCTNLTELSIPSSVSVISKNAFSNCTSLTNILIQEGVKTIGEYAFSSCGSLTNITIPQSITAIRHHAFENSGLQKVIIRNPRISLASGAFATNSLKEFYLYASNYEDAVSRVSDRVFVNGIPRIFSNKPAIQTDDGFVFAYISQTWAPDEQKWYLIDYKGTESNLVLPSSFETSDSTILDYSIVENAFFNNSTLINLTIPNNIIDVDFYAFNNCPNLKQISIPGLNFVSSIFTECPVLTNVIINDGVTSIPTDAFFCCSTITTIYIPDSVTSVGSNAFGNCSELSTICLGEVSIAGCTAYCPKFKNIVFHEGITSIADSAFSGCISIQEITIPDSVTKIGKNAFSYCTNLNNIVIPDNVTSIGAYAFQGCTALTNISISNCVTEIGSGAFSYCNNLTDISIPEATTILSGTFENCTKLSNVHLPNNITSIGGYTFYNCSNLTSISIPSSVTELGYMAFANCPNLKSITIPNGATSLSGTFEGCTSLTEINIPNSVTSLSGTFTGCSNLTSIIIPDSVTRIYNHAFEGCSKLTSISIPCSVTNVESNAFKDCSSLTSAVIPECVMNTSYNLDKFYNIFSDCPNLSSITIQNGVTKIPSYAFKDCTTLTEIIIPESVTEIWDYVFCGCTGITSITIPSNVEWIGNCVFSGCTNLSSVTISEGVECMLNYTFENCTSLSSITIPSSFTSIGDYSFTGCTNLSSVTFMSPDNWRFWDDSSTYIDCSNPETNALNLKSTYVSKQWVKRDN